jgi:cysteinyl-tRNA synthetase
MRLYNTLTEKIEDLPKAERGALKIFVCGPTVYDTPHIGNMRTYAVFDIFARFLKFKKIRFFYLQNITDIDDKIIARAKEKNVSPIALARQVEREYHEAEMFLGIKHVTKYARASDYIAQIVAQVKTLIKKRYAYKIDDGYYFDIAKFADYGKLAKRTAEQAEDSVSRIDESIHKRNKGDFVLWKLSSAKLGTEGGPAGEAGFIKGPIIVDGEPLWETELGTGRPGWHIEDTAISEKFFGPQYDIHGGGVDIKFPHHEAEIAQQEAASGKSPFVKLWMHAGSLLVNGKKMSKSLGNFITIADFLQRHKAEVFRYLVAAHNYRSPLNYTSDVPTAAAEALSRLKEFAAKLTLISKKGGTAVNKMFDTALKALEHDFVEALEKDLNTPEALAAIFAFLHKNQKTVWKVSRAAAKDALKKISELLNILGLSFATIKIPTDINKLVSEREERRRNKDFAGADDLRKQIETLGYIIEDTPLGPLVLKS